MESMLLALGYVIAPATLLVCAVALWQGSGAERHAGVTILLSIPLQWALLWAFKSAGVDRSWIALYCDIILSITIGLSFLWAALRYTSTWLGAAFLLQGFELATSAYVMGVDFDSHRRAYFACLNLISFLTLLTVLFATVARILARRRETAARADGRRLGALANGTRD
jgi:hypothetical protein